MSHAHDLCSSKTAGKMLSKIYWPAVQASVRRYCRSCAICLKTAPNGRTLKVSFGEMSLIYIFVQRVALDLVGPIQTATNRSNRCIWHWWILLLGNQKLSHSIQRELQKHELKYFVELGFRKKCWRTKVHNLGQNWWQKQVNSIFDQLTTTPYTPMCDGLIECFNWILK